MDLIYTDARHIDQGVLTAYSLDLSFGEDANENDFELTLSINDVKLEDDSVIYFEGTEYGGVVGGLKTNSESETRTYIGRTWHGLLNVKVIEPNPGEGHLVVSGDANEVLGFLIDRLGLSGLFRAETNSSGVNIQNHQFDRYCKGYDGIRKMLKASGAKLHISFEKGMVELSAVPLVDYSEDEQFDEDQIDFLITKHHRPINQKQCANFAHCKFR